jgi:hypothetical protein
MNRSTIRTVSILLSTLFFVIACISKTPTHKERLDVQELTKNQPEQHGTLIKVEDIHLTNPLNQQWIAEGKSVYDVNSVPKSWLAQVGKA